MSPSSLIFVAVIATWATYLVVHVARRREQLATARNVDRFSSQMRVLQRRAAARAAVELSGRVSSTSLGVGHPLVAGSPRRVHSPDIEAHTLIEGRLVDDPAGYAPGSREPYRRSGRTRVSPVFSWIGRIASISHEVRAALLFGSLAVAVVTTVLTAVDVVGWYVPVASLAVVTLLVVRMRAATLARRAARSRAAAARKREHLRAAKLCRQQRSEERPEGPAMPVAQEFVPVRGVSVPSGSPDGFDLDPLESRTRAVGAAAGQVEADAAVVDPLFAEHDWEPTPVPPPTYTLKAKAYRPLPPPADVTEVPVPIEVDADDMAWEEGLHQSRILGA